MRAALLPGVLWLIAATAGAQSPASGQTLTSVRPIECWWRSDANSVRVGELFSLILTCAVLDTSTTTVVPDQSRLDPAVLQLTPFEVTGGRQAADVHMRGRRFFQYEYTLRYIGEDIGRDVELPSLPISYKVQSRVEAQAAAIETRDRQYILPARNIRVVSLVPFTASDIRDRAPDTFRSIAARRFRASVLRIIAIALFVMSAAVLVWTAVRALGQRRGDQQGVRRLASDGAILAEVARQLDAVEHRRRIDGWTPDLLSRALAALRVAGAYAATGHVIQTPWSPDVELNEGEILVRTPLRPGRASVVSGSATAGVLEREILRRELRHGQETGPLADLHPALVSLDLAAFGRDDVASLDLDAAMASGMRGVDRVRREYRWPARRLKELMRSARDMRTRVWTR